MARFKLFGYNYTFALSRWKQATPPTGVKSLATSIDLPAEATILRFCTTNNRAQDYDAFIFFDRDRPIYLVQSGRLYTQQQPEATSDAAKPDTSGSTEITAKLDAIRKQLSKLIDEYIDTLPDVNKAAEHLIAADAYLQLAKRCLRKG